MAARKNLRRSGLKKSNSVSDKLCELLGAEALGRANRAKVVVVFAVGTMAIQNNKLTPEQMQAMQRLTDALVRMEAVGLCVDAIAVVLDGTFAGICNELGGGTSARTWHRKTDPFYYSGSTGRIRAAEATIVRGTDPQKK
jgi:hypothetical protein